MDYNTVLEASIKYFGNELSARAFVDKYALKDNDDNFLEKTPHDMHMRLAKEFARIESNKFKKPLSYEEIMEYLVGFRKIIPQGSPMYGIGNPYQVTSLSNCFVIESPLDSYNGILYTDLQIANLSKRRGGVGWDISTLRPKNVKVNNAAKTTTGATSFMNRFSNTLREVGQGGRRGAGLTSISVHHPDILDFITIKNDNISVTGCNISVRLTDEFLNALHNNENYELRWPEHNPTIKRLISAKRVWDTIIHCAWLRAEPGLLFWDNIIRESPADCYDNFKTVSTNPCLTKDTLVYVADGRGHVSIGQLAKENNDVDVFCSDNHGRPVVRRMRHPRITGYKQKIYKVVFDDGNYIRCTGQHQLKMKNGQYKEITNISVGESVDIITKFEASIKDAFSKTNSNSQNYWWLNYGPKTPKSEHRLIAEHNCDNITRFAKDAATECGCKNIDLDPRLSKTILKMENMGYKCIIKNNKIYVEKICENCNKSFFVQHFQREVCFCNIRCSSIRRLNSFEIKKIAIARSNKHYENISVEKKKKQLDIYTQLKYELQRIPHMKEWESACTLHGVPKRLGTKYGFKSFKELQQQATLYNHRIISIEEDGYEDVYNGTVDEFHNFYIGGFSTTIDNKENIIYVNTKQCGELPISAMDSCRLLAMNLFTYVKNPFNKNAYFDYNEFYLDAQIAQRLMDDIVDLEIECINKIIDKVHLDDHIINKPELELWHTILRRANEGRRTGTGPTALGDALAALNIKYGSKKSIEETEKIYKTLKLGCYKSSVDMAKELGPFPVWDYKKEQHNIFLLRIKDEDAELYNHMKRYGRRNIALLTTAPTGTVSMMAQLQPGHHGTTSGIEPLFTESYIRRKKGNPGDKDFRSDFVDQSGDHWMEFNVNHPGIEVWTDIAKKTDIEKSPYVSANNINWINRVKLQAAAGQHVDHSISSTINLPNGVSEAEVSKIYVTAWQQGLKGITVYRDGCRTGVLVNKKIEKRPRTIECDVHHITAKGVPYFVLVGVLDDKPYEVFAGKNGCLSHSIKTGNITKMKRPRQYKAIFDDDSELCPITVACTDEEEAFTRMISIALRNNTPVEDIVTQLEKTQGDMTAFSKSMARALKKYIKDGTQTKERCPECNGILVRQEGCIVCLSCSYSKC